MSPEATLRVATKVYLNSIRMSTAIPWSANVRSAAVSRYLRFRDLWVENPSFVSARDVSFVWAADMMQPQSYILDDAKEGFDYKTSSLTSWYANEHTALLRSGPFESVTVPWPHWRPFILASQMTYAYGTLGVLMLSLVPETIETHGEELGAHLASIGAVMVMCSAVFLFDSVKPIRFQGDLCDR